MQFFLELILYVLLTARGWLQRDNDFNASDCNRVLRGQ